MTAVAAGTLVLVHFPGLELKSRLPPDSYGWRTERTRTFSLCDGRSRTVRPCRRVQASHRTTALTELLCYARRGCAGAVPQQIGLVVNVGDPSTNTFVTRRSYWLQGLPASSHLVLVHYLPMEHGMHGPLRHGRRMQPARPNHLGTTSFFCCMAVRFQQVRSG